MGVWEWGEATAINVNTYITSLRRFRRNSGLLTRVWSAVVVFFCLAINWTTHTGDFCQHKCLWWIAEENMFGILLKTYRRVETWKLDILETIEKKKWFYAKLFSSLFKLCTNNPAKQVGAVHQGSLPFSFQQQISLVFVLTFVFLTVFTLCFPSPQPAEADGHHRWV